MTQTIEQLTARVRELEEENARLVKLDAKRKKQLSDFDDVIDDLNVAVSCINPAEDLKRAVANLKEQAATSQAYAEQLRKALNAWIEIASNCSIESGVCGCGEAMKNHSSPMMCGHSPVDMADSVVHSVIQKTDKALAIPHDTSALDAYVAEKVKEGKE